MTATAITASAVKELREKTGVSMMACKKALEEVGGDLTTAIELLRKRGEMVAQKRSSHAATAPRFKNAATKTRPAPAQARSARVPLVVDMMIVRPRTRSGVNSQGELPRSNSVPPVRSARMRTPSRSPARRASGSRARAASASGISATGRMASAP